MDTGERGEARRREGEGRGGRRETAKGGTTGRAAKQRGARPRSRKSSPAVTLSHEGMDPRGESRPARPEPIYFTIAQKKAKVKRTLR